MDLDIKRVLASKPGPPEDAELARLVTPWGAVIDPDHVLEEHPRPQFERTSWTSLNGWWDYAICESSAAGDLWASSLPPVEWDGRILVPFSPEASLSGVGRQLQPHQLLWYRRQLPVDGRKPDKRHILHLDAVDYACACYVNDVLVGTHVGGYLPFDVDVTDALRKGKNVVELCVHDPSETGTQLRGKQRLKRGNMWYTAQSGIWKTAWLEEVPEIYVTSLDVRTNADNRELVVEAGLSASGFGFALEVIDADGAVVVRGQTIVPEGETVVRCNIKLPEVHLWDVDDPYLYSLRVQYDEDVATSYCAFRTVGVEPDEGGVPRFCLNHRPVFVRGLLDQGYWPDGLMTPPSDEALVADIQAARDAGFNMLRKHIKLESDRWYWHCDRLGMLVWQDMVSGGDLPGEWTSVNIPTLVRRSWTSRRDKGSRTWRHFGASDASYREEWLATAEATVRRLAMHPCVATWVVFNESWGQFDSAGACDRLRKVDGTRPMVAASGWYDQGAGEFFAVHNYFRGMRVYRDPHAGLMGRGQRRRAFIINEFGGLVLSVEGHTSVPTVYGYDTFEDADAWRQGLRDLLAEVDALEAEGLSGYVYTQLSDVEEETNGLMTYDRRVNKLA